ncbi:LacI family DNA-binding transcriptional regulator [Streptococcus uberis]|uniref:LacI family DNA-binding transcriptional regulator n=1 Tax=Streptococcus uberis TaxID=1349 RepID=UPI0012B5CDF7|nr:LacI family DNA-binding transcriptional regulator [Streptococcus uberis]MTB58891.1 substrate-binding domain-containing protein [Streptococcus uberis]MTC00182.1 substrate-binding domain-containing protein [Streptococcus uberis]
MNRKSFTMKDVAKRAGVSVGTVSRVINQESGIKKVTLEKVTKAIAELNYVPDNYARGMKTNRTETVALIVPTIWHPFFSEFAFYIEKELSNINYKLLLCNTDGVKKEIEYINMLQQNKVDGIIAITYSPIEDYLATNIPFVSIDRSYGNKDIPWVSSDNYAGGQKAAEVLVENGCKNLLFVGSHNQTINETKNRRNGFEDFLRDKGVHFSSFDLEEPIENFNEQLYEYLAEHLEIDGIFAINDFTALDIIDALAKLGKNVPHDVQIIGYDGIKFAKEKSFPVSTIKQPLKEMAQEAVRIVLSIIENEPHKLQITLPISYIDGPTTKK